MGTGRHDGAETLLDVRDDLKNGQEPFQKIMSAAERIPLGGSLVLLAPFKPIPLLAVLGMQGFESEAEPMEHGDWRVVFRRTAAGAVGAAGFGDSEGIETPAAEGPAGRSVDVELDNRGLEPPEPMVRTLEAINRLQPGERLVGHYDRKPMFLMPKLDQMGYAYEVTQHEDGSATLVVTSAGGFSNGH